MPLPAALLARLQKRGILLKEAEPAQIHEQLEKLKVQQPVLVETGHREWSPLKIVKKHDAPRSYIMELPAGGVLRRNQTRLRLDNTVQCQETQTYKDETVLGRQPSSHDLDLPISTSSGLGTLQTSNNPLVEEEVIAEDYDDNEKTEDTPQNGNEPDNASELTEAWKGCPNKWNIYHECAPYCKENWGNGKEQASPKTERKRLLMLKKYPVPNGWEEVYDPGVGRHYYWNTQTDEVAWLPPGHPRSKSSLPAEKLRALIKETFLEPMDEGDDQDMSESEDDSEDEENEPMNEEKERIERRPRREYVRDRSHGRAKVRENDLDPMDPAAYSEAPRGTWSSGLDRKGEAKTGADTTASGPLYQMRPYPSPGAVLRLNAEIKDKVSSDSDDN